MEDDFCVLSGLQVKKSISVLVLKMVRFYMVVEDGDKKNLVLRVYNKAMFF